MRLGILPPLGSSLGDFARHGQLDRLREYYFPAYLERFSTLRFFSYEPEQLEAFIVSPTLRARIELVAPSFDRPRHVHAIWLATAGRRLLEECAVARALHATGGLPSAFARVPLVCTYGYDYPRLMRVPRASVLTRPAYALKRTALVGALRLVLRRSQVVITTSKESDCQARVLGARRTVRIPNGVDLELFSPPNSELGRSSPERMYDLIFVGHLARHKGPSTLVEAAAKLDRPLRICFVGSGPDRDVLESRCWQSGIDATFAGTVSNANVADLLRRASVFVLPSPSEGQPKAMIEAMAVGLACVGTDIPTHRELASSGGILLFPPGNSAALAQLLRTLLGDPALRERLGAEARATAIGGFEIRRLLETETKLLHSLGRSHGSKGAGAVADVQLSRRGTRSRSGR